jgi:transcription antitermination factor NusG
MSWIVVLTKPNQERIACENLARQNFEYYWPRFLEKRPTKTALIRSLFPRYLFVSIDKIWYPLTGTRGIAKVLLGTDGPLTLPSTELEKLRRREGADGLIQLSPPPSKFDLGDKVKALDGPLAGHILIYDGMTARERCRVLATLLGGTVKVELDEKLLVAA